MARLFMSFGETESVQKLQLQVQFPVASPNLRFVSPIFLDNFLGASARLAHVIKRHLKPSINGLCFVYLMSFVGGVTS